MERFRLQNREMIPDQAGRWVLFDDHKAAIHQRKAEIRQLEEDLERTKSQLKQAQREARRKSGVLI